MKLGVIGCGKMGRALVGGILKAGIVEAADTVVFDTWSEAAAGMAAEMGVHQSASNEEVVTKSDVILLCVKPQGFLEMLEDIGESEGKLLISIAAGVKISSIESATGGKHRVVRVMPNTPALVGKGAAGFALGSKASADDAALTSSLLGAVGYVTEVTEADLDAVTAVSGSGPAYVFLMIEALVAGGIEQGLSPEVAEALAAHTVAGAAELLLQSEESPAQLRENVTSPNGTTFAALESFRGDHFEEIVKRAVTAATERSRELGGS
ncbi:MAG: pyrroline-5-carboxylate reductase [Verrucomicrobiales bacterium]|nr:pyrroline-5-carboxylate reductase [Verrucomicrobiales bacterium]